MPEIIKERREMLEKMLKQSADCYRNQVPLEQQWPPQRHQAIESLPFSGHDCQEGDFGLVNSFAVKRKSVWNRELHLPRGVERPGVLGGVGALVGKASLSSDCPPLSLVPEAERDLVRRESRPTDSVRSAEKLQKVH